MAVQIRPTTVSKEKWMNVTLPGSTQSLFTFSGFAEFVLGRIQCLEPEATIPLNRRYGLTMPSR